MLLAGRLPSNCVQRGHMSIFADAPSQSSAPSRPGLSKDKPGRDGGITRAALAVAALLLLAAAPAFAADPEWLDPSLLAAAKGEGAPVIYSSVNEEEEQPQLQRFEAATGIHVDYVRSSDTALMARIAIEARAGKQSWDVIEIQAAESIPKEARLAYALPRRRISSPAPRTRRTAGSAATPCSTRPATTRRKSTALRCRKPTRFHQASRMGGPCRDRLHRPRLARRPVSVLWRRQGPRAGPGHRPQAAPVAIKAHLALARALGEGEYWVTLNNFVNLTLNVSLRAGRSITGCSSRLP